MVPFEADQPTMETSEVAVIQPIDRRWRRRDWHRTSSPGWGRAGGSETAAAQRDLCAVACFMFGASSLRVGFQEPTRLKNLHGPGAGQRLARDLLQRPAASIRKRV